jgi:hypothetical protein
VSSCANYVLDENRYASRKQDHTIPGAIDWHAGEYQRGYTDPNDQQESECAVFNEETDKLLESRDDKIHV